MTAIWISVRMDFFIANPRERTEICRVMPRAIGAVDVYVAVHAALLRTFRRAAEVHPAVRAIELEVERLSRGIERLTVAAPAI